MNEEGLLVVISSGASYSDGTIVEGMVGSGVLTTGAVGSLNGKNFTLGWLENTGGRQRSVLAGERIKAQVLGATKYDLKKGDEVTFKS